MSRLAEALARWTAEGTAVLGEVLIRRGGAGGFVLHHARDDPGTAGIEAFDDPQAARQIAAGDAEGAYRPLKSAPTLRRGWMLRMGSAESALEALGCLYPGAVGLAAALESGSLDATPLRETLDRQTGMYRVASKISDEEAGRVTAETCAPSNCLKVILWETKRGAGRPALLPAEKLESAPRDALAGCPRIPLVCREACNFLVADARRAVKRAQAADAASASSGPPGGEGA